MRRFALLSVIALCSCASGGSGSAIPGAVPEVPIGTGDMRVRNTEGPMVSIVTFPLDRVWRVLPSVYDSLRISLTDVDPAHHMIGNSGFKVSKRLGAVALSKYLDCGKTQGFPSADTYEVSMAVFTQLDADKSGATTVSTRVDASARPMQFNSTPTKCVSTELLENTILGVIKAKLNR
jgi:hypothetical protein